MKILFLALFVLTSCLSSGERISDRPTVSTNLADEAVPEITPTSETEEVASARPSNQIFIERDFCACMEGKPVIFNNCESDCTSVTDQSPLLTVNTKLGPEIELNDALGNLFNWCTADVGDGLQNPKCELEAWDGNSITRIEVKLSTTSNSFQANLNLLSNNTNYVMTLVETGSGSNARSESFQLRMVDYDSLKRTVSGSTLKISPIHRYFCTIRAGGPDDSTPPNNFYNLAINLHFFYNEGNDPPIIPPGNTFTLCHDVALNSDNDSPQIPRLGLIENDFYLWDQNDLRFYSQDSNEKLDINDLIQDELAENYGFSSDINIFAELTWPNFPGSGDGDSDSSTLARLGFIMQPWIDSVANNSYCPTQREYNSSVPVMQILKKYVGVDTEGLYFAVKEPETFTDSSGNITEGREDYLLIREGLLKQIWFYFEDSQHFTPTPETAISKTIMFYWPPNPNNPFVKQSTQKVYTLKHPNQLNITDRSGLRTTIIPPDKRFACIPKGE